MDVECDIAGLGPGVNRDVAFGENHRTGDTGLFPCLVAELVEAAAQRGEARAAGFGFAEGFEGVAIEQEAGVAPASV